MIRTKDEIIESIQLKFAGDNSDEAIALLEDVSDTIDDLAAKAAGDGKDWEAEAKRIDAEWRERYKARFMTGKPVEEEEIDEDTDEEKTYRYEELFEKE